MASLEPGKIKYAAQISAPSRGVQPITFILESYEALETALKEAENKIDKRGVELTFHESRINSYKNKIKQHEDRMEKLNDPNYDPSEDDIEMEEVS